MRQYWLCGSLSLLALACGGDDSNDGGTDAGLGDAATSLADGASGQGADAQAGLPNTCAGDCSTMNLVATFGTATRTFDRAFFGLTSPQMSDSGAWEIYIENGAGEDDQCPTMKSPLPDYLLLLAELPLATDDAGSVSATANLIDFEGALLPSAARAEAVSNTVTWSAYDPCIACAEGSEDDRTTRMVAVDIEATFAGGSISGHSYATHCDSLDSL